MRNMISQRHIFIGGTGRSGTTILGAVFNTHPDVLFFGEPHFLMDPNGLCDYLRGQCTPAAFEDALIHTFRQRLLAKLTARGFADAPDVYAVPRLRELVRTTLLAGADRTQNARAFMDGLFALGLQACGKLHWVEKTPLSILVVDLLFRLYPDMRYIHMIREPKGVCASMLRKEWGPKNADAFIASYGETMRAALVLATAVPNANYIVLSLEALVHDRAGTLARAYRFAGLPHTEAIIADGVARIRDDGDHPDQWKTILSADEARRVDEACGPLYRLWLDREAAGRQAS